MSRHPELEVTWTQTMATAEAKRAQQRPTAAPPETPLTIDVVAAYLEEQPGSTIRKIHQHTYLSMQQVTTALYDLLRTDRVIRSHRQQEDRSRPMRWRLA